VPEKSSCSHTFRRQSEAMMEHESPAVASAVAVVRSLVEAVEGDATSQTAHMPTSADETSLEYWMDGVLGLAFLITTIISAKR